MKAVILTRVSTKMQEEGLSLTAQSNRLFDYAERKGLDVIKHFEIIESSTRGERKRFMEMIAFCKRQHETIAIVADTVDRVQRSFKESVLLDELMRQNKIELHFYREGMILNSQSTSVDIMRWDFSVMGAKAYVLQLSENVRRSTELKVKNGERSGVAPLGYENYVDERGKHNIRIKDPDAQIIKQIFELYSLGRMSGGEAAKFANMMGLTTKVGKKIARSTIYYIIDNPFYYGEMKTKHGLIRHVYQPLVSKELWDLCQERKAENNSNICNPRVGEEPVLLRGLIRCGITHQMCICEQKHKRYFYVFCYNADGTRYYVKEQQVLDEIKAILNRIRLPDDVINELQEELKKAKSAERQYCRQEIVKLKTEQDNLKQKLDHLFDLRLDGELDRETFDTKRNEIQLKMHRLKNKIASHEKADNAFNCTLLELLDIATEAGQIFTKSNDFEMKRLLLKFVFKGLTLTLGKLTYELNFPFSEFEAINIKKKSNPTLEIVNPKENKAFEDFTAKSEQIAYTESLETQISDKKQRVTLKNETRVQSGWDGWIRTNECRYQKPVPYHLATSQKDCRSRTQPATR